MFPLKRLRFVPPGFVSNYAATGPLTRTSHPRVVFMGQRRSCEVSQVIVVNDYQTFSDDEWRRFIVTGHIVYVHVIAIVYRQGTVYGSTGPCGELRGNVVR